MRDRLPVDEAPVRLGAPPAAGEPVRSLYVHAPFCARRCVYCDFAVTVARAPGPAGWLEAVGEEWRMRLHEGPPPVAPTLETLYVGGGTPSLLGEEAMEGLAGRVGRDRLGSPRLEWTAEANPESLTPTLALAWRRAGVNRLSIGVQSLEESVLRWMGRLHGPEGARSAIRAAREAGFDDLNVDLIFGLPDVVSRSWPDDVEGVLALEASHVSLYGLTIEAGTPLGRAAALGRLLPVDEERYREEFLYASERLRAEGYEHYEVSNFARPGHRSRHNDVYWSGRPYVGLGNGAHSYSHPVRSWNLRDWHAYRQAIEEGRTAVADHEVLDAASLRLERIWLGLRTARGLARAGLPSRVDPVLARWSAAGWIRIDEARIRATPEGWLVMDRMAVELSDLVEREVRKAENHGRKAAPTALDAVAGPRGSSDEHEGRRHPTHDFDGSAHGA